MARKTTPPPLPSRRQRGFEAAGGLLTPHLRQAAEKRGFAIARLLTHWAEIVGADLAPLCRPVKISHAKGGLGATLTLLTSGAAGPMVQMQLPTLRERINACYGYNAIARITLTQTAPTGFATAQTSFTREAQPQTPPPQIIAKAHETAAPVQDADLRAALERLALNVLSKGQQNKGSSA